MQKYGKKVGSPSKKQGKEEEWFDVLRQQHEGILHGVVAYVDVFVEGDANTSQSLISKLESLGAKVNRKWSRNVTHLIFKDGSVSAIQRAAKNKNTKVVSPLWIAQCEEHNQRVGEEDYVVDAKNYSNHKKKKEMQPENVNLADPNASQFSSTQMSERQSQKKPKKIKKETTLRGSRKKPPWNAEVEEPSQSTLQLLAAASADNEDDEAEHSSSDLDQLLRKSATKASKEQEGDLEDSLLIEVSSPSHEPPSRPLTELAPKTPVEEQAKRVPAAVGSAKRESKLKKNN